MSIPDLRKCFKEDEVQSLGKQQVTLNVNTEIRKVGIPNQNEASY